jgi:kynurenine formamidase
MGRVIDLSLTLYDGMPVFPSPFYPKVAVESIATHEKDGRSVQKLVFATHLGTHIDAPLHYVPDGKAIHEVSLNSLVGEPTFIDMTHKKPSEPITEKDLEAVETGALVLIHTGWVDKHWGKPDFYEHAPHLTKEAAEHLAAKRIRSLGLDTLTDTDWVNWPIHKTLLGNGVIIIEYLRNLAEIKGKKVILVALPLKIRGGDGSPARVIAIER